jgi:putative ABC transport system permease protein
MVLTFLNLVVVSGILVGLIEGAVQGNRENVTGDLFITTPSGRDSIANTQEVRETLRSIPDVVSFSVRYSAGSQIEANYRSSRPLDVTPDQVNTTLVGINPGHEEAVTGLSREVVEGNYLNESESGFVLLGVNLLSSYLENFGSTDLTGLSDVSIGDTVIIESGGQKREFIIGGLVDAKSGEVSLRAYITERDFIELTNRTSRNANEIAVDLTSPEDADNAKNALLASGLSTRYVTFETWEEAQGQFLDDIKGTFSILGSVIGGIALVVASITIFIIVFVNAISRRKQIGILKGIGITGRAIIGAYVIQALFYAMSGAAIGITLIYTVLVPYFRDNPIDFPFSDGILVAPIDTTMTRLGIMLLFTIVAGFIPAYIIIRRNTLDAILGRS